MFLRLLVVSKLGDNLRQTHLRGRPSGLPESNLTPQPPGLLPWSRRVLFGPVGPNELFKKVRGTPVSTRRTRQKESDRSTIGRDGRNGNEYVGPNHRDNHRVA